MFRDVGAHPYLESGVGWIDCVFVLGLAQRLAHFAFEGSDSHVLSFLVGPQRPGPCLSANYSEVVNPPHQISL